MKAEREKHIKMAKDWVEIYHRDKFKTAITDENPIFYNVVTKVNYLTTCLWLKWRNEKVNDGRKGFVKLSDKPDRANFLIHIRNFKRRQERMIRVMEYLEQRKTNKLPSI